MKSKNILSRNDTIEHAINVLNNSGKKICFVLSKNNTLEGVVTDSEIRRALINQKTTKSLVHEIMNSKPIFRKNVIDVNKIKTEVDQLGIHAMPIINEKNELINVIYGSFDDQRQVDKTTIFILAGGKGTRLGELTKSTPKPMLEVDGKPLLEHIILSFRDQGFSHFVISTYYLADQIIQHFGDGSEMGVIIEYTKEKKPLGTAGSLSLVKDRNSIRQNLLIINGDILTDINFRNFVSYHESTGNTATICVAKFRLEVPYGVCDILDGQLLAINEKPNYNFIVNTGIYVMKSKIIHGLEKELRIDMPDLIKLIKENEKVGVYPISGLESWIDIGHPKDLKKARTTVRHSAQHIVN